MSVKTSPINKILWLAVIALMALAVVLPLAAQDDSETTDDLTTDDAIVVVGEIIFTVNGDIVITDEEGGMYVIAPAGAFTPSILQDSDVVIIIGRLLPDGLTIQAIEFEFFVEEEDPEATPEVTPEATAEATPEITPEATAEATPEVTEEPVATCGNPNHPVAARIAEEFEVSQQEVMAMHCQGHGFGNIARAFLLARAVDDGTLAQDFLNMHHEGQGWGNIMRGTGVHPSELAPGRIGRGSNDDTEETAEINAGPPPGRGNSGNAPGNGRGNNGNGNGNGRGNGNGNGNGGGNDNGPGNGRGNGNGGGNRGNGRGG